MINDLAVKVKPAITKETFFHIVYDFVLTLMPLVVECCQALAYEQIGNSKRWARQMVCAV